MKIEMILTNAFEPDIRVYKEAKYLVEHGVDVEILCWDRSKKSAYHQDDIVDGIKIRRFNHPSVAGTGLKQLSAFMSFAKDVKRKLKKEHYEYVHCHDFDGRLVAFLSRVPGDKCIFDMHEFYERGNSLKKYLYRKATLEFIKQSRAALYENDVYLKRPYGVYSGKLYSLKNYPDREMIKMLPKEKSELFRVGYHGTVRNQVKFFKALFEAVKDMKDVRVDVNGGGIDYPILKELSSNYSNVFVNGPYNGAEESNKLYANTDVLFCGYDKSVPNHQKDAEAVKFFEAIITGTPMIMQKDIGMGEKVTRNGFGIAVDTDNTEEVRSAICKLKTDHLFFEQCRSNELEVANQYNWENEVAVLKTVYSIYGEK